MACGEAVVTRLAERQQTACSIAEELFPIIANHGPRTPVPQSDLKPQKIQMCTVVKKKEMRCKGNAGILFLVLSFYRDLI